MKHVAIDFNNHRSAPQSFWLVMDEMSAGGREERDLYDKRALRF